MEPPDTKDRPVSCTNPIDKHSYTTDEEDVRHPSMVPAAGRGNSEDGKMWINPSANQLLHACQRKDKQLMIPQIYYLRLADYLDLNLKILQISI